MILFFASTLHAQSRVSFLTGEFEKSSRESNEAFLRRTLRAAEEISFKRLSRETDRYGKTHESFQMMYRSIPVEDAIIKVHSDHRGIYAVTGETDLPAHIAITPKVEEVQALSKATGNIGAQAYKWQDAHEEKILKEVTDNPQASFYPKAETVVVNIAKEGERPDFRLAYKFDIYASKPVSRDWVYVDASSGEVVRKINRIYHGTATGTAATRYAGTRTIKTDSIAPNQFRLKDMTRGNGVITYNLNHSVNDADSTHFVDNDNQWTAAEYHNGNSDDGALDAHWGAGVVYDYWKNVHNQNSWDGNNAPMINFVHYNTNYPNAFWDGYSVHYGQYQSVNPWTELDVVGHEFGHGLMFGLSNLNYSGEGKALHEGCADIWGALVDNYGNQQFGMNRDVWVFSESIASSRDFNFLMTYKSIDWDFSTGATGHINGQVARYWFYLLVNGGSGANKFGINYNITPIGISEAEKIFYQAFKQYVTPNSNFSDFRQATELAAQDVNSAHVATVKAAWDAVGVPGVVGATIGCMPSGTQQGNIQIDYVSISNKGEFPVNPGWSSGGYIKKNYVFNLILGKKVKMMISYPDATAKHYAMWMDIDRDGQFEEPSERLAGGTVSASSSADSIQLPILLGGSSSYGTVPVRLAVSANPIAGACDDVVGEVEDFTAYLSPPQVIDGYQLNIGANADSELIGKFKIGSLESPVLFYPSDGFKNLAGSNLLNDAGYTLWAFAGESYSVNFSVFRFSESAILASYIEHFSVWIDFDANKVFDADELVFQGSGQDSAVGYIKIPAFITPADSRMRVLMSRGTPVMDPYVTPDYGEVADYNVRFFANPLTADGYKAPRGNCWHTYVTLPEYLITDSITIGSLTMQTGRIKDGGYHDLMAASTLTVPLNSTQASVRLTPFIDPNLQAVDSVHYNIWVDYNGDKDFNDAGEHAFYHYGRSKANGVLTIPVGLAAGLSTRMRLSISYFQNHVNADSLVAFGQIMDLGFAIQAPFTRSTPLVNINLNEDFGTATAVILKNGLSGNTTGLSFNASALSGGVTVNRSVDTIRIASVADFNGQVKIAMTTSDGSYTLYDTITVTVNPVNDAPYVSAGVRDTMLNEDVPKTFLMRMSDHFSDVDQDALTIQSNVLSGSAQITVSDDSLYIEPAINFNGDVVVELMASDGDLSVSDTFIVQVTPIQDAPYRVTALRDTSFNEDVSNQLVTKLTSYFSDPDNDLLTYNVLIVSGIVSARIGQDSLYITAQADATGPSSLRISATDGNTSVYDTITVTVTPVNDAPLLALALRDTTLSQTFTRAFIEKLTDNFTDVDNGTLQYSVTSLTSGLTASLGNDSIYVTGSNLATGTAKIAVQASDGSLTANDTLQITIIDVTAPSGFVAALASPLLPRVRFTVGGNEILNSAALTVNNASVTLTKRDSKRYSGQYDLTTLPTSLTVVGTVTDLGNNVSPAINRTIQVSTLSKPLAIHGFELARVSGAKESIVLVSEEEIGMNKSDATMQAVTISFDETMTIRLSAPVQHRDKGRYRIVRWTDEEKYPDYSMISVWQECTMQYKAGVVITTIEKSGTYALVYDSEAEVLPTEFVLNQNYPNPFNPTTTIRYDIAVSGQVSLIVYNLLGQKVRTLINGYAPQGTYRLQWDGNNDMGQRVSSGVYLYRLESGGKRFTKRMMFLK